MLRISIRRRDAIAMGFYFYIGWSAAKAIDICLGKAIFGNINKKENEVTSDKVDDKIEKDLNEGEEN